MTSTRCSERASVSGAAPAQRLLRVHARGGGQAPRPRPIPSHASFIAHTNAMHDDYEGVRSLEFDAQALQGIRRRGLSNPYLP